MVEMSVSFVLAISTLQDGTSLFFSKSGKTFTRLHPVIFQKNAT